MKSTDWYWNPRWYLKNDGKILLSFERRKSFGEEFLCAVACKLEHDSQVILTFSLFESRDSCKKNSYKKTENTKFLHMVFCFGVQLR